MDITKLTRDAGVVKAALRKRSDKSIITTQKLQITILQSYIRDNLIELGEEIRIIGMFGYIVDDTHYAVSNAMGLLPITPDETSTYTVDDKVYNLYTFYPGSVVIPNCSMVKDGKKAYYIYNALMSKGYVPWYYNPSDKLESFDTSQRHAKTGTGCDRNIIGIHTALLTRDIKDEAKQFRFTAKSQDDIDNLKVQYVGAKNVTAAVDGTIPATSGSYPTEGFTSALVNPTTSKTTMEDILTGKF